MGDKYDSVMRRNRLRIRVLAVVGLLNYWVAALLFVFAVTIGALFVFVIRGIADAGDFELLWKGVRAVPKGIEWAISAGWLSSRAMTWAVMGFVAIGTGVAVVLMWGRLRKLENTVPHAGATDPAATSVLEGVAIAAGVQTPPSLVVLEDPAVNSCSVGRKPAEATIAVTSGLRENLSRDELEAVLAYELSRVTSLDTAVSTWMAAITGRTIELSQDSERVLVQLALFIPARLARGLRARTLRRQAGQRDILALSFTRHPEALLSALEKIDADPTPVTSVGTAAAPLWLKWPYQDGREPEGAPPLAGRIDELRTLVTA